MNTRSNSNALVRNWEERVKSKVKQAFFGVVLTLLVVGILEITVSLLAFVSPRVNSQLKNPWCPPSVLDSRLGRRPNPDCREHDSKGFRNLEVPTKAHIVALGDSQTYGTGVESQEAWPRQLESMIGETVYSIAYGGYGPAHSLILLNEAIALQPDIIIEAFYAGNDLYDSFNIVYNLEQLPELKSADAQVQARVRKAELARPIDEHVARMFRMGRADAPEVAPARGRFSPRTLLSEYSKIYGILRSFKHQYYRYFASRHDNSPSEEWEKAKALAEAHPAYTQICSDGPIKTILTNEYRLSALDLKDPRIAEGLQISLGAIKRIHERCSEENIRFLVVLIPTKETVFREFLKDPSQSYHSLIENEEQFRTTTKDFLAANGIEYLNSLPALREQLATGTQPYRVSWDGHPNGHGHNAIAKLLFEHLER